MRRIIPALAAAALLTGCYVEEEPAPSTRAPEPAAETDTEATGTAPAPGGGRSTLGKAKQSATNTVGDLERRSKDIEKQLDEE
ncbi:MAG: hypothetical protein GY715_18865 [Planctomycetes bacterium]|nr:hypothetical protein [Planctomycetota bacterium]